MIDLDSSKIVADYHVHFGQFYDVYYQPATVIKALAKNGIKEVWASSTTSLYWNTFEEKKYILNHIEEEIKEALCVAKKLNVKLIPLFRVSIKALDGKTIAQIMENSHYKGFKVHTKDDGYEDDKIANEIMEKVCQYASLNNLPILIHTGVDSSDLPNRFEYFFHKYRNIKFVLAHCKAVSEIIKLFSKYNNVFGDTAFCSKENYNLICKSGFKGNMQFGTDFPITQWFEKKSFNKVLSEKDLTEHYKKILKK